MSTASSMTAPAPAAAVERAPNRSTYVKFHGMTLSISVVDGDFVIATLMCKEGDDYHAIVNSSGRRFCAYAYETGLHVLSVDGVAFYLPGEAAEQVATLLGVEIERRLLNAQEAA